jgi:redox-sensitive bicupin YhaK (pirin superfamily)
MTDALVQQARSVRHIEPGTSLQLRASSDAQASSLAQRRWGSFVMNTDEDQRQAMRDYWVGLFGRIPFHQNRGEQA